MLTSLAIIFLTGMLAATICGKFNMPKLMGMILIGTAIGPYSLNLLSEPILSIAPDLRQLALIIILLQAGLSMDIKDLVKVGRPAILMCFLPATFEIAGVLILGPILLDISWLDAAIAGSVLAAVSPAVVVPRMLLLLQSGYGQKKSIPQLIMAGASADDIYVIVLFAAFSSMALGGDFALSTLAKIPMSIVVGITGGVFAGLLAVFCFRKFNIRDSVKIIILLSISFLFIAGEKLEFFPFSGLLAVVCTGLTILKKQKILAQRLSDKFSKLWVASEILLFVLVGATVDIQYAVSTGLMILLLVFGALIFRMIGVWCCLIGSSFSSGEKLFCMLAFIPKATVQSAIGAIPLGMGLGCGQIVLAIAVVSILTTAPLGALAIDLTYSKLLRNDYSPKAM